MRKRFIHLLFLLLCFSCSQRDNYDDQIKSKDFIGFLNKWHFDDKRFKKIIVIPGVGCGGCISDAQTTFTKNYKDNSTLYIFTSIADLKLFKNSLPNDAFDYGNVILDLENILPDIGFKSIYPSIIDIQEDIAEVKRF